MTHMLVLVASTLVMASCGKLENRLVVANHSGVTADQVTVAVCTNDYVFEKLRDGETREQAFAVTGDSGFRVKAQFADGSSISNGFGYVTGGAGAYGNHALVEITKDKQIIGKQY